MSQKHPLACRECGKEVAGEAALNIGRKDDQGVIRSSVRGGQFLCMDCVDRLWVEVDVPPLSLSGFVNNYWHDKLPELNTLRDRNSHLASENENLRRQIREIHSMMRSQGLRVDSR